MNEGSQHWIIKGQQASVILEPDMYSLPEAREA